MLKKFDFLGRKLSFYYDSEEFTKTSFGGVVTIFLIIILGLLISGLGQDFFKRTNPSVITSTSTTQAPPIFNINNKNFSMGIRISRAYGGAYTIDEQVMYIDATYYYAIKVDGVFKVTESKKIRIYYMYIRVNR